MSDTVIFDAETQQVEARQEGETARLTQEADGDLFDKDTRTINVHVGNVLRKSSWTARHLSGIAE